MIKILILVMTISVTSCSMLCPKPTVVYEKELVNVYPTLLQPPNVVDSKTSIYNPISDYISFNTTDAGDVTFSLHPTTYGYDTYVVNDVVVDVVMVDSMHYAEMLMVFDILMNNHIFTKKFFKLYKKQYERIEEDKDLQ